MKCVYPFKQPNYFKISNEYNNSKNLNCKGPTNFFKNVYHKKKMLFMEVKDL